MIKYKILTFILLVTILLCVISSCYNEDESFIVTFDTCGAGTVESVTVKEGERVEDIPTVQKAGSDFLGWYLGETPYDFNTPVTSDITLEAHWITSVDMVSLAGSDIEQISFPSSVKTIAEEAFRDCTSLLDVELDGVEVIGARAFVDSSFYGAKMPLLTRIGGMAFANTPLYEITLPSNLTFIGDGAFAFTELTKIVLPSGLEYIEDAAFFGCNYFENVYFLSEEPCNIGSNIFTEVDEEGTIYYSDVLIWVPNGNSYMDYRSNVNMRDYANSIFPKDFEGKSGYIVNDTLLLGYIGEERLERLEVPSGVESIADFAFYNRRDIKDVVMPEGFKKIGRYAFYNCTFLTPFEWRTEGEDFYIRIDGNNKLPENSDYIGVVEYAGEYDAITDSFTVSFMLNDYAQMMNFACQRINQIYATGEVIRFFGTYKCLATANPDYAMFTLVSYGNGRVDVYIGDQPYKDCTYIVEDGVISIDFQTLILVFTIDKDGRLDGDFLGTPCHFDYIDELMDSTKLPGRDDTEQ